ncbi:hypothetical protein AGATL06_26330 [Agathobaculum sp. TL06]
MIDMYPAFSQQLYGKLTKVIVSNAAADANLSSQARKRDSLIGSISADDHTVVRYQSSVPLKNAAVDWFSKNI